MSLTERAKTVLQDIVDIHTQTGEPVGSKALVEQSKLGLSSASYRNVMADLEKNGYLISPHTSAGRVPTESAYRFYAQNLVEVDDLSADLKSKIEEKVNNGDTVKEILNSVSDMLSEMTNCTGLVMAPRLDMSTLKQVEFLRLEADKVLAVIVTNDGEIENRVIQVPASISIEELNKSSKHLREIVEGRTLADARVAMMQELMEQKNHVDNLMSEMMEAAETWAEPQGSDTALVVAGSNNLFQYPELVRDQLKSLFNAFEEKRMLMALMNKVQDGHGVQIYVGADCPVDGASGVSMIGTTYGSEDKKTVGTIGVIGPMRMDYKKTIQVVNYTGKLLSKALSSPETQGE